MSDNTFSPDMTSDSDDVQDAVVVEDAESQEPTEEEAALLGEMFEWEDDELTLARMFRPYTPPKPNQHVPLVITDAKLDDGDYGLQIIVEAEHRSEEFGDKPSPYRIWLSKVNDRNPNKTTYPMGAAFRATGVLTPDGQGKKKALFSELVPQLIGKEFIGRVFFQDKPDNRNSSEVKAYWGKFGAVCNGDGEHLTETNKKSTDFKKRLYFNPQTGSLRVEGDVFADDEGNPIVDPEGHEIVFGTDNPNLNEDTGFGVEGTPIKDLDDEHYEVVQTQMRSLERINEIFIPMPDRKIEALGRTWLVTYETITGVMPPVKTNAQVTAFDVETGETIHLRYGLDSVWVKDESIKDEDTVGVEEAGFGG